MVCVEQVSTLRKQNMPIVIIRQYSEMYSRSEYQKRPRPPSSILVRKFDDDSDEDTATNPNLSLAEDLIKYKTLLGNTLENDESMTLEELETCENLNPFRDWFVKIITQAIKLKRSVSDQFLHQIEEMTKAQVKLAEVMQKNDELEQKNQQLNQELLEATGQQEEADDVSSDSVNSFQMFGTEQLPDRRGRQSVQYSSALRRQSIVEKRPDDPSLNGSFTELSSLHKQSPRERRRSIANIQNQVAQVEDEKKEVQALFMAEEQKCRELQTQIQKLQEQIFSVNSENKTLQSSLKANKESQEELHVQLQDQVQQNKELESRINTLEKEKTENFLELVSTQEEFSSLQRSSTNLENRMKNRLTQNHSEADTLKRKYKKLDKKLSSYIQENQEQKQLLEEYEQRIFNYEKIAEALERTNSENAQHRQSIAMFAEKEAEMLKRLAEQAHNTSVSGGGDASFILEQNRDQISAVVDPEMRFVNLVIPGENGNLKTLPTKIKLINSDNSMLDVSQSYNDGGMVDLRHQSLIYGADASPSNFNFARHNSITSQGSNNALTDPQAAISPPSKQKRKKPLPTPAFGQNVENQRNQMRDLRRGTTIEDGEMVAALENNTSLLGLSQMINPNQQNENVNSSILNLSSNMLAQVNQYNNTSVMQQSMVMDNDRSLLDLNANIGAATPKEGFGQIGSNEKPIEGNANAEGRSYGSDGNQIIVEMNQQDFVDVQNESLVQEFEDEGYEPANPVLHGQNMFASSPMNALTQDQIERDFQEEKSNGRDNPLANSKKSGFSFMPPGSNRNPTQSSATKEQKDPFARRFSKTDEQTAVITRQSSFGQQGIDQNSQKHKRQFTFAMGNHSSGSSEDLAANTSESEDASSDESKNTESKALLKANQRRQHTQTNHILGLHFKEVSIQTDIAYYDKRFVSTRKVKSLLSDDKEEKRREKSKLKQEREESIQRLIKIERKLQSTSHVRPAWEESSSDSSGNSEVSYHRMNKGSGMPPKRASGDKGRYSESDRRARPPNQGDCCNQCSQ